MEWEFEIKVRFQQRISKVSFSKCKQHSRYRKVTNDGLVSKTIRNVFVQLTNHYHHDELPQSRRQKIFSSTNSNNSIKSRFLYLHFKKAFLNQGKLPTPKLPDFDSNRGIFSWFQPGPTLTSRPVNTGDSISAADIGSMEFGRAADLHLHEQEQILGPS